jgi:hypothetical protein
MGNKRTTIVAMSLLLTVVLVFSGCAGGGSKLVKHELTIGVQGKGSVTPEPGKYEYTEPTVVELQVTPDEGREFSGWLGDKVTEYEGQVPDYRRREEVRYRSLCGHS